MCLWARGSPPAHHHGPSSFFSSVSSGCNRALQTPSYSPPIGCCTASIQLQLTGCRWEARTEVVVLVLLVVRALVYQILICADTTKETGGRRKNAELCSCQCSCSVSGSLSSLSFSKAIYEPLLLSLLASLSILCEKKVVHRKGGKGWMTE